jgi:hypothetical protein
VGKSVGWSLLGRWSTGAWRAVVCGVARGCGGGMARGVVCVDGAFGVQSWTTPLRRSLCATSTAAERGQVPDREAPGPSKKFWRVRPQGGPPRSRHARSSCEPIRDLRPRSGGGTGSAVSARSYAPLIGSETRSPGHQYVDPNLEFNGEEYPTTNWKIPLDFSLSREQCQK